MYSTVTNIPPYIWTGIFKLLQILGIGLILGLFASRYQKRKEVEIKVKGNLLLKRLEALEKVNHLNNEIFHKIAPSAYVQVSYLSLLERFSFPIDELEYAFFCDSEAAFDDYYKRLGRLISNERIFFDYDIDRRLSEYQNYLTEIKVILDAYCDVVQNGISDKINIVYKFFGVIFQQDFNRFHALIDQSIAKKMRKISLAYKDQYFKRASNKIHYKLSMQCEKHLNTKNLKGKISQKIYYNYVYSNYGNSVLIRNIQNALLILMYFYYSDRYTIEQFDNLPEEERTNLIKSFHAQYMMNYHA